MKKLMTVTVLASLALASGVSAFETDEFQTNAVTYIQSCRM
jgi:hypothetical protein